jgi:hypothetical protein
MTRLLLPWLWLIGANMPMVAQPLHILPTLPILFFARTATSLWSIFHSSGSLHNGFASIGKSQLSQKPRRSKSTESGEPVFTSRDALLYSCSFETGDFYGVTIMSGLIYHSIGDSATWYSTHAPSMLLRVNCVNGVFMQIFFTVHEANTSVALPKACWRSARALS